MDAVLISTKVQIVLPIAVRKAQGWDFAQASHHALSEGCDGFVTLDADLVRRGTRRPDVLPKIVKL
jgi:hypothetical protein